MDSVKVSLGIRWMTVEAARQCVNGKEWRALVCINVNRWKRRDNSLLGSSVLFPSSDALLSRAFPGSEGLSAGRSGVPLHDAVCVNNRNGVSTKYKTQVASIYAKGRVLGEFA